MPKEAWSYALLLIILCAIASIAVWQTIAYLAEELPETNFRVAAAALWALTLGFMLIAGAFGLWATQFAADAEARRRISLMVQAMDYIRDAVVAIDPKGGVTGANPAAADLAGVDDPQSQSLCDLFPCVSDKDILLLTNRNSPHEIERRLLRSATPRVLRFRSQPSRNVSMVIISDITAMNERQAHSRQAAKLQLVGEISKGVAHDFNSLLCEISGHASLFSRLAPDIPELQSSAKAVIRASERGVALSGQLIELAKSAPGTSTTTLPGTCVQNAAATLRNLLPEAWQVETSVDDLPALSLTGTQAEQIILNLGLLSAEALGEPGVLRISAAPPEADVEHPTGRDIAGVIEIRASTHDNVHEHELTDAGQHQAGAGAIQSVIRSLVAEAGGALEEFSNEEGAVVFRLCLPQGRQQGVGAVTEAAHFPRELGAYVSRWSALLATPQREFSLVEAQMHDLNMKVRRTDNIVSVLTQVEENEFEVVILDGRVIEQEMQGLLRAIVKLQPAAGVVVLCDNPEDQPDLIAKDVVFLPRSSGPNEIMLATVEARSIGVHRASASA